MTTKKELGEWRHIVLFAKYHYGEREDVLKKLKEIHSYVSGVDTKYISTITVINKLITIMDKLNVDFKKFLREFMSRRMHPLRDLKIENFEDEINYMLTAICNSKVKDIGTISKELDNRLKEV